MPLVLSLRKDQDFYVGEEQFVVSRIHSSTAFDLKHMKADGTSQKFHIHDARLVEILPGVFASAGEKPETLVARVTIEAPRSVLIIRGDLKRNPPPNKAA